VPKSRYSTRAWQWKGGRIVGTVAAVAEELSIDPAQLAQAIEQAGLQPWGRDARGDAVFRMKDVRELIGRQRPAARREGVP
jgi:hypothetical protein